MTIRIRPARPADAPTIAAYNSAMAVETEGRELDPALIDPGVAAVLGDPANGLYWVAEVDGELAGQLLITYEWSDWRNGRIWWIQSVYVPERHRRRGVFSALYRHVETLAAEDAECCGIRLYVEKDNERAKDTYRSLGMRLTGYDIMEVDFREAGTNTETGNDA